MQLQGHLVVDGDNHITNFIGFIKTSVVALSEILEDLENKPEKSMMQMLC